ncbi:class I SAM-dependent methyltransferase [Pelagibius litoralis]|uniref:Class I SAM-dependent methyltransferase n=1 Tax=Pelagibius litoralis TaxID=374515 RepID=A0A967C2V8_9PROT|nr:class I SAM-dependent methyltransferase [Pelagibius litoralis]NIA68663.1 class I SAM-dependent methyltransferase [Pelagibius litoralis]
MTAQLKPSDTVPTPTAAPAPTLAAVKEKQQAAWASGDYAVVGTTLQIVGEQLCETLDLRSGSKVLDVAAGNGNATLAAARRFCSVTSTDYVESLLNKSRERAAAEHLDVAFQIADAEALPFDEGSFDAVLSTFGVMFTPDQAKAAAELSRVCRSGGRIALANWTPPGFIGQVFKTIGKHIPPAPGMRSPALWGTREALEDLFGDTAASIELTPRLFNFRYHSADHFMEVFRTYYGPIHKAFLALGDAGGALDTDLRALLDRFNVATDGTLVVPSEYVEVVIRKA